jgi:hypothetical protein
MMVQKRMMQSVDSNQSDAVSLLSDLVMNLDPNDFYLRPPNKESKKYVKCKVYFFNKPDFIEIEMMQTDLTKDVIRHIMTMYRKSPL